MPAIFAPSASTTSSASLAAAAAEEASAGGGGRNGWSKDEAAAASSLMEVSGAGWVKSFEEEQAVEDAASSGHAGNLRRLVGLSEDKVLINPDLGEEIHASGSSRGLPKQETRYTV
mmetsp:Transcript_54699/g.138132  ORF Transcript_54699/g.138132 Transcript_54699/m.138132 type:complete len:116 (+) Transcript_54699:139-486(+)